MHVEYFNLTDPSPEEEKELEKLKVIIKNAVADGKISRQEIEVFRNAAYASQELTAKQIQRRLELYRTQVTEKIWAGELEYDW